MIALDSFITKENINFCLYDIAEKMDLSDDIYKRDFSYKLRKLNCYIDDLSNKGRIKSGSIRDLKKSAFLFKKKQANINWINPKDSLQSTWISMYLTWTGNCDLHDLLIDEHMSQDSLFYAFSRQEEWRKRDIYSIFEDMKEDWAHSYVNRYKSFIEINNEKQWQWIFDYLNNKSVLFSSNRFPPPTDKKSMYEYLFSLLSIMLTLDKFPHSEAKYENNDTKPNTDNEVTPTLKFVLNMQAAWRTHLRRSAIGHSPIYDHLSKSTAKKLEKLCRDNNQSPKQMIQFLVDTMN